MFCLRDSVRFRSDVGGNIPELKIPRRFGACFIRALGERAPKTAPGPEQRNIPGAGAENILQPIWPRNVIRTMFDKFFGERAGVGMFPCPVYLTQNLWLSEGGSLKQNDEWIPP